MKQRTTQNYSMKIRGKAAERTRVSILETATRLWLKFPFAEITLEKIAEEAGVTIRTVLRKYNSKESLMEACIEHSSAQIIKQRTSYTGNDYRKALTSLLDEYEVMGDAVYRAILLREEYRVAGKIIEKGMASHREWCKGVFSPWLPDHNSPSYETCLSAFICATEIYLWKLLRKDMGKSKQETYDIFITTLEALIEKFSKP